MATNKVMFLDNDIIEIKISKVKIETEDFKVVFTKKMSLLLLGLTIYFYMLPI